MKKLNLIFTFLAGLPGLVACSSTAILPVGATAQIQPIEKIVHATTTADDFYQLGRYHQNQQRWAEAAAAYRSALEIEHNHIDARNRLGAIYAFEGKFNDAIDEFKSALAIAPDSAASYNNLGYVFFLQYRYLDAVSAFEKSITLDAVNGRVFNNLGDAYVQLGLLAKSYQAFEKAEQLRASKETSLLDVSRQENITLLNDRSWDVGLQNNDVTIELSDANQEASSITLHSPEDLLLKVDYRIRTLPTDTLSMPGILQWKTTSTDEPVNYVSSDKELRLKLSLPPTGWSEAKEKVPSGRDAGMLEPVTLSSFSPDRVVRRRYQVVQEES